MPSRLHPEQVQASDCIFWPRSCKGSKRTSSSVDRWEPSWAIQTDAAILAATTAAHELTDKINDARGDDLLAFSKVGC